MNRGALWATCGRKELDMSEQLNTAAINWNVREEREGLSPL